MPRIPSLVLLIAGITVLAASSGCERVAYWSGLAEEEARSTPGSGGGGGTTSQSTGTEVSVDEAAVLRSAATCAGARYGELAAATTDLARRAVASAESGDDADRDAARVSWRAAIDAWERVEAIRVGPVGPASLPGGGGARDEIYAWPMTSRCLVEQTIVSRAYEDVDFGDFSLFNVRGLGAEEYLLFYEGTDNACGPASSINETGAWDAIDEDDLAARKRAYAAAAASALDLRARQVDATWRSDGEAFGAAFAASGAEGAPFATTHAAVQALFAGVVVVARQLRDDKLRAPLDAAGCDDAGCEVVEAPYAHASARLARLELAGLVEVVDGCAAGGGLGIDDLLAAAGHADVDERLHTALADAVATLDAIDGDDLAIAIGEDRPSVDAALAALAALALELESDVAPALGLEIPDPS